MLAALYLVLWQGPHSLLGRTLFIAHLGLFMLWQPFVQTERRLSPTSLMAVVAAAVLAGAYLKGWMIVLSTSGKLEGLMDAAAYQAFLATLDH